MDVVGAECAAAGKPGEEHKGPAPEGHGDQPNDYALAQKPKDEATVPAEGQGDASGNMGASSPVDLERAETVFKVTQESCAAESAVGERASRTNNFLKGVLYSPDGLCILSNSNDNRLRLYEVPALGAGKVPPPTPALVVKEPGTVYDLAWYPYMNSNDPASCVFVSTCHKNPTHLWDAFTGKLRATYRSYDHADEITAALSVAFSGDGSKLICGFDRHIRIFDIANPGRDYATRALVKTVHNKATRKRRRLGQKGLISCIDGSPHYDGMYACGSYAGCTYIYEEKSGKTICNLEAHSKGVTQVKFAPDATRLWTGGRKDDILIEWDLRMLKILKRYFRRCNTNQKYYLDVSRPDNGRYLITGTQDGNVKIFDTTAPSPDVKDSTQGDGSGDQMDHDVLTTPALELTGMGDAVNGVSFHPSFSKENPLFAICTGERKFWLDSFNDDDEEGDEGDDNKTITGKVRVNLDASPTEGKSLSSAAVNDRKTRQNQKPIAFNALALFKVDFAGKG